MKGIELKEMIKNSGLTMAQIVIKSGIPQRTIYNIFEKEKIELHYLIDLKKALPNIAINTITEKTLPLIPELAKAGSLIGFQDYTNEPYPRFIVPGFQDCDMLIQVSGDSMFPLFTSGDIVAIKRITDMEFIKWGSTYIVEHVDGAIIKILKEDKDQNFIILESANKNRFPDMRVKRKQIKGLSLVKGKVQKLEQ